MTTQANSNVSSIGAALEAAAQAAEAAKTETSTVASITAADKAAAAEIVEKARDKIAASGVLKTAGEGLYGCVMRHVAVNGATFDGIEAAAPELKTDKALSGTFRPIKSMILKAQKLGLPLVDETGAPLSKGALAAANKAKEPPKPTAENEKDAQTGRLLSSEEIVAGAIGFLRASAALRDMFGAEILGLAEAYKRDVEISEAARLTAEAAGMKAAEAVSAGIAAAQDRQDAEAAEAARQAQAVIDNAVALKAEYDAAGLTKAETAAVETKPETALAAALETAKPLKGKRKAKAAAAA